jgi:hypothetical protein
VYLWREKESVWKETSLRPLAALGAAFALDGGDSGDTRSDTPVRL